MSLDPNKILEVCDTVIAWSIGFNTHNEQWYQGNEFEKIDFRKFKLIAIRDYHPSGLEWLPCPSALAREIRKQKPMERRFGIIEHKNLPAFDVPYDKISNQSNLQEVSDYIASSEAVVTNSYHITYWALLMGRKAIVLNKFSTKFDWFKYKPEFIESHEAPLEIASLAHAVEQGKTYDGALDEATLLNDQFFIKVKDIIEALNITKGNDYQQIYQLTRLQQWNDQDERRNIHNRIEILHSDVHRRIDQEGASLHKRITESEQRLMNMIEEMKKMNEGQDT